MSSLSNTIWNPVEMKKELDQYSDDEIEIINETIGGNKNRNNSAPTPFKVKTELTNNNNNHKITSDQSKIDQLELEKKLLYENFQTENKSLKQGKTELLNEIKILKDKLNEATEKISTQSNEINDLRSELEDVSNKTNQKSGSLLLFLNIN
jgi:uncharacterized coiled-coil DUF342 family protein